MYYVVVANHLSLLTIHFQIADRCRADKARLHYHSTLFPQHPLAYCPVWRSSCSGLHCWISYLKMANIVVLCMLLLFSETYTYERPLSSETYHTIVQLLDGTFDVPAKERTSAQRSAVMPLWRGWYFWPMSTVK